MSDERDFDVFYATTAVPLVRHIYLSTGDLARAQECVQEAYIRAWLHWAHISSGESDPVAWTRRVAWRLAINDWRRGLRLARALVRYGPEPPQDPPSADVTALRDALGHLSMDHATVVVLHYFEGLSVGEIADLLDISAGTVKSRLSRARSSLARHLEQDEEPQTCAKI